LQAGFLFQRKNLKDKKRLNMERQLREIWSLRADIEILNASSKSSNEKLETSFDLKKLGDVVETLKRAKSLLEQRQKFQDLTDGVRKIFDFHHICQMNLESSMGDSKEYVEALETTLKGARSALTTKLDDYLKNFPFQEVEETRNYITEMNISEKDRRAGKEFTNLEILSHIEYFIKILPNDQLSIVSDVATQESKNTLDLLAKTFEVASKIANPETSFEDLKSLKEAKIPDVEVLLKDAKRTLEHERYMKETQQSKGRQTPNLELILSKQIPVMKSILYQISVWVDELLKVHKANVDLKFKFKSKAQNMDETIRKEVKEKAEAKKERGDNASSKDLSRESLVDTDFDDGLSDVAEDVNHVDQPAEVSFSKYLQK